MESCKSTDVRPTLLILAAGMGSRYGGLKQLDGIGPNGETIMDYSVYDAIKAGFGKVVFVIRKDFEEDFRQKVLRKYENLIPTEVVFQAIDILPKGFTPPRGREKPWGTNHAVLMGKKVINEPFAVINADDFYGRESFNVLAQELKKLNGKQGKYTVVGFPIANTLSESGTVNRGVMTVDEHNNLIDVTERIGIQKLSDGSIVFNSDKVDKEDDDNEIPPKALASMNMWGFTPDYMVHSESLFIEFLGTYGDELKSEYYIPTAVTQLINTGKATVSVLSTSSDWYGVTYLEDRPNVVKAISRMVQNGEYPSPLF